MPPTSLNLKDAMKNVAPLCSLSLLLAALTLPLRAAEQVNTVVAKVGGEVITSIELDRFMSPQVRQIEEMYGQSGVDARRPALRQAALKQLIEYKLLSIEAKAQELQIPDIEIEKQMDKVRARFATEEDFRAFLDQEKMTLDDLRKLVTDEYKARAILQDKVIKKITVLPTEIHDYYQLHVSEFMQPSQVRLFQILIKKTPSVSNAYARALEVLDQLSRGGNFQQIARLHSDGPKRDQGGDWGVVEEGTFGEEMAPVEKAAFALKPGEYSTIIETKYGFHIVYIDQKRISRILSEREAYDDIYRRLFETKLATAYEDYMTFLRDKSYVEIYDPEAKTAAAPGGKVE